MTCTSLCLPYAICSWSRSLYLTIRLLKVMIYGTLPNVLPTVCGGVDKIGPGDVKYGSPAHHYGPHLPSGASDTSYRGISAPNRLTSGQTTYGKGVIYLTHRLPHGKLMPCRARIAPSDRTPRPTNQPINASILPCFRLKPAVFN